MKLSRFSTAFCAVTLLATTAVAQTPEEMKKDLDALKAQVAAQKAELDAMKADKNSAALEASVENEINRLSERLAAATTVNSGANKLTFTGEFRNRSYLEIGDNNAGVERDGWTNDMRVRLGTKYEFSKDVSAYAELQSHWAWGDNGGDFGTNAQGSATDVNLYQAWVKLGNIFNRPEFSSKWGRQEVVLGNQFQFGNADWYNGLVFDGARYDWDSDSFSLTGLMLRTATGSTDDANQAPAYGTDATNTDGHDHDEFYSIYFTLKTIKNHTLDLYWIYANAHVGNTQDSGGSQVLFGSSGSVGVSQFHTFGGRIGGNLDVAAGMDWNLEAAYQTGDTNSPSSSPNTDIEGLAVEGEVGLTFNKDNALRVWIRGLWMEGPDATDQGYLALWPNRHSNTASFGARYGAADAFPLYNTFTLTGGVHFDPAKDWTVGANLTWATTESDFKSVGVAQTPGLDDSYGFEVDVWATYRYSEALTFSGGFALLFPDDQLGGSAQGSTKFDGDAQFLFWLQARLFF
jgi:hypothetical protein